MSFGKKSSKPAAQPATPAPTITPVEQKPAEPIQRAAIAERAETAESPQLLATTQDDEQRRRQAGASLLGTY